MYDRQTDSLWLQISGEGIDGSFKGVSLVKVPHVQTTWAAWKEMHPDTLVLSLDTGYQRDYSEGEAYREYFATDRLMFTVPFKDGRRNGL